MAAPDPPPGMQVPLLLPGVNMCKMHSSRFSVEKEGFHRRKRDIFVFGFE